MFKYKFKLYNAPNKDASFYFFLELLHEFHITYLDYNNKTLYYRKYTPNNINNIKESFNNRVKLNTIDILGRETNSKGFHIEIYNDGSVEKKYVIE